MSDKDCDSLIEKLHLQTLYEKKDNGEIKKYFDAIFRDAIGETKFGEKPPSSKRAAAAISAVSSFLKRTPRVNIEMASNTEGTLFKSTALALAGENFTAAEESEFFYQIEKKLPDFIGKIISEIKESRNV